MSGRMKSKVGWKYIHPYILVTVDTKRRLYADVLWTFVCMCLVAHKIFFRRDLL